MDKISMITLLLARAYTDKKTSEVPAVIQYKGVTTTALSDGATTNPITINGSSYTAVNGDTVFYDGVAYTFDGTVWQETISLAQIITELEGLDEKIGDLTDLTTTDKDSVVDAINELVTAVGDKVDKVDGKGLSTNDYTDADAAIVAGVTTALAGKQDTLTFDSVPTDGSTNPVESNGVYDALALKQDKTDNTLQTTSKTVVGAVNELKSGLTTLDTEVNGDATTYDFADVVTIEDAVPSNLADCSVKIEPVQDLHGYDKPWVGGAWKNQFDKSLITSGNRNKRVSTGNGGTYSQSDYTATDYIKVKPNTVYTLSGSTGTTYVAFGDSNKSYVSGSAYTFGVAFRTPQTAEYIKFDYYGTDTATDGTIQLEEGDTATSYAPYSNICPITGHTEASVQRDGKNLFDESAVIDGKVIDFNTGRLITHASYYTSDYISVTSGDKYTFSGVCLKNSAEQWWYDENKQPLYAASNLATKTVPNGAYYFRFSRSISDGYVGQIEKGETATPYVPYAGKTYTIALGDTIYGGTVDFETGVMTVTHKFAHFTDLTRSNNTLFYHILNDPCVKNSIDIICDREKSAAQWGSVGVYSDGYGAFMLKTATEYSSASDCLAAYGGEFNICYPLATPLTVQLTPQQIQLLKGTNTLTASTGQISVTANGVSGAIGAVQTQANSTDNALAQLAADIAEQLPDAPTTDGAYVLTVTVVDGTPTYSWESAT